MTITQILQKIRSAFYTKAETDAKLNGKSNTNHNHNSTYLGIKAKAESAKSADSVAWSNVSSRPTKVSQFTNDSGFAIDSDVVHKSGDEDINGTKSFKTMPKIAGTYLGNELSTNERTCLYLTSNRDTIDKSGAYLVRFRQNRDQGALEGVSYISQDILENGTRYPRVLVSGLAFGSEFTPSYYYLSSQSSIPSQLGQEDQPWDKAYLTDCIVGNTLEVKDDVWVGGDQLMITSDETEVFTGRRISWAKNAGTLPTKAYNLNFSLGGNNSAGWANRIGGFRVALNTTGDVETAMYAHDTTGASKGQGMIGIYYKRDTDKYETIAPTPPAGDNSTQIATTAWVTAKDNNVVHKTGNETITGLKTFEQAIVGALKGNADTSTQFSANKSVTLTGDVTGTASSKGGWSVATTLANSGVTAGTYGPSKNVTGNNNATISVPQITVDAKGRVTSVVNRTLTCKNNTYTVPTKVSQLTNDSGYVKDTDLADVATSGSYNDLANKPTIPSVYNKTLTIQKNGTKVAAFTSNSNNDVTANITVPTKVSELTNDSGFITGISWNKVTGKPTLATVATSGSYNDLSNKPTITQNYLGRQPKTFKTLWTGHFASDSVKLSEPFTNYKWLLVKLSNDNDWGMHYHYISTYDLNKMLEGEKHGSGGYVNKSVTLGGSYLFWNIHTYANGSTTTYFSYEDDNCRLLEIIGINEFY